MNAAECGSSCLCWNYRSASDPSPPTVHEMRWRRDWIFYSMNDENGYVLMKENSLRTTTVEWHGERRFHHRPTMENQNSTFDCGSLQMCHVRHGILHRYVDHPLPYDRRGSTRQSKQQSNSLLVISFAEEKKINFNRWIEDHVNPYPRSDRRRGTGRSSLIWTLKILPQVRFLCTMWSRIAYLSAKHFEIRFISTIESQCTAWIHFSRR